MTETNTTNEATTDTGVWFAISDFYDPEDNSAYVIVPFATRAEAVEWVQVVINELDDEMTASMAEMHLQDGPQSEWTSNWSCGFGETMWSGTVEQPKLGQGYSSIY